MAPPRDSAPEFARPIEAAQIGAAERVIEIAADAGERAALARRFDLLALDRFEARVRLRRLGSGVIRLSAEISAEMVQACVVTLEPVASRIDEAFSLLYGIVEETREVALDAEAEDVEPLVAGMIDIGEAAAQQLSLSLNPFPRAPEAFALPAAPPKEAALDSPFAVLKTRHKRGKPRG
ncbi:MAG TPA: DUF177 domain-containing protein [Stellaceae bacterium]|nr:DUF177 domain-containing protein [Stellaceae bacterium]